MAWTKLGRIGFYALLLAASIMLRWTVEGTAAEQPPGSLIRAEPMAGAPDGAAAFRVLYRSTGLSGEPMEVSGVVIVPAGQAPPEGRPVLAWAHPTTGIVSRCAPSLARVFFSSVQGLREMLDQGYVVAATDYPGLGTPEVHPYLVGESEGRAVLDSVRAARNLPGSAAGRRFAVWGHSQGGHAALFAGLMAHDYAPELALLGIAAAAPATDLAALMREDQGTPGGNNITAMTLWSWSRLFDAPMEEVVTPEALPVIDKLAGECIERWFDMIERKGPTEGLERGFLRVPDLTAVEPWRRLMAANTPGPLGATIPVYLAQGTADNLVRPDVTEAYARTLCQAGGRVRFNAVAGVGHAFIARDAAPDAIDWISARFDGQPPPSDCDALASPRD